ncbi:hypothetical protein AALP_AAs73675U000100 [Arabis alpina]|uniref:Uncharacterized protein n=1 Tax=Arabis alpina TaxID=50452 RepID=A0A087FZW3_ARAAL|nr:hypothetical protein AALP_AAs73675U000100 [Arabis alpina]
MGIRSFRELASGSAGAFKTGAPPSTTSVPRTTSTPSIAPNLASNTTSVPSTTPAPSTASAAKKSARMPSSVVLGMPASDPCDARKKAKGKAQETVPCDRGGSESRGDDGREPKRPRTDPPSPSFLAFVNRGGHELEAEIEKHKHHANAYAKGELAAKTERNKKVPRLEDDLASLTADVEAHKGGEEYFDKLMESLGECLDVVLPEIAADAGVADVSGSHMFSENAGGLLQEMRIDSAGLLKNLMISEDRRMSFAGEEETEVTTVAAESIEVEKTKTGEDAAEIKKTVPDVVRAEKAASKEA